MIYCRNIEGLALGETTENQTDGQQCRALMHFKHAESAEEAEYPAEILKKREGILLKYYTN